MGWETAQFGDVCKFVRGPFGGSLKKNIFVKEGYAVYEQQHAINDRFEEIRYFVDAKKFMEMSRFELFPGDLIMSCSGTMGKIAVVPENIPRGIINQALLKLTPAKVLSSEFLKYWMNSSDFQNQIKDLSKGVAIKNMASVKILKEIKTPVPSRAEQKRIVAILDQAFADIEHARALTERNLKNARELFDSALQQVFARVDQRCEIRSMSDTSLLQMIDGDRGKNYPKKADFQTEGHCLFLSTKNVRPSGFLFDELLFIDKSRDDLLNRGRLSRNDVVITTRGTIGNTALYDDSVEFKNIRINSGMLILRPNTELLLPSFLFELMRSGIVRKQIEEKVSGAAQPQLPIKTLNFFKLPIPASLELQQSLVDTVQSIESQFEEISKGYKSKLRLLEELKKSLLQKAFSGQLTTEDAA